MKIISVVGSTQSGSTMLFNMIRLCLIHAGYRVYSCGVKYDGIVNDSTDFDFTIVKCHPYNEFLAKNSSIIFLPIRDFRDAVISWKKRYYPTENLSVDKYIENILFNIDVSEVWKKHNPCILKYENYVSDKIQYLKNVIQLLDIQHKNIDLNIIIKKLDQLQTGVGCPETDNLNGNAAKMLSGNLVYVTTLMTKAHNTSGGRIKKYLTDLDQKILHEINSHKKINEFLSGFGYDVSQ